MPVTQAHEHGVERFAALGLDRAVLPYRTYGEGPKAPKRFVALKFPVAVDAKVATFVCVDPGLTTDSELRAWGVAHAPLWAALRTRTFAMHVVTVGPGAAAADRAASVLTHWTRDGDGQAEMPPAGPTRTSAKNSPGLRKRSAAATVSSCPSSAAGRRRPIATCT